MAQPIRLGIKFYTQSANAATLTSGTGDIDFGSASGRWIIVHTMAANGSSAVNPQGVTAGGVALTAGTNLTIPVGGGKQRPFTLSGATMPTGVADVVLTADDPNGRLSMIVEWGHTASGFGTDVDWSQSATNLTPSLASTTNSITSALAFSDVQTSGGGNPWTAPLATLNATGTTAALGANTPVSGTYRAFALGAPGAATTNITASWVSSQYGSPSNWGRLFSITGTSSAGPTISTQPQAQTVTAGQVATFTVVAAATGGGSLSYQWQKDAVDVSGATSASYPRTTVIGDNGSSIRVLVTETGGSNAGTTTSNAVTLTVNAAGTAPNITTHPASQSVVVGATATFSVVATGTALTYQWQRNPGGNTAFAAISGATSSSFTTPAATISGGSANNADSFRCTVTGDTSPPATSTAAVLTVSAAPIAPGFTVHPQSTTKTVGETATFTVSVTGTPTPALQWRRNGVNISGATSSSYTTAAVTVSGGTANNGDIFTCYASNTAGNATSNAATLTVNASAPPPSPGPGPGVAVAGPFFNNTLVERWRSVAVTWSWWAGSTQRVGALTSTPVHGLGTIGADGLLATGLSGYGVLMVAIQRTDATDDDVFYQAF